MYNLEEGNSFDVERIMGAKKCVTACVGQEG